MKFFKKLFFGLLTLTILTFLLRNWLFWQLFSYQSVGDQPIYAIKNPELRTYIERELPANSVKSPQFILKKALQLSAKQLHFSAARNHNDPNLLIDSHSAHCVGYAAFTTTICNELLHRYQLNAEWKAEARVGQIHFLGINVHPYFQSAFFKDHDFVVLRNLKTGEELAADPTVYDYLGIGLVRVKR
ncbi:MAG: hypothetical protein SFV55_16430 [Haliscomenobacter sp.]|uniref:hypothetical protein n=1 Tax=Haliscomenobacter sp. TaxID=2717303 RepID=UPI0029B14BF8|nr:hypothetical protein [Haliscomenobacter sp.]MDX2070015.1 hypothetical protein [Haliscomenobacter sp.]